MIKIGLTYVWGEKEIKKYLDLEDFLNRSGLKMVTTKDERLFFVFGYPDDVPLFWVRDKRMRGKARYTHFLIKKILENIKRRLESCVCGFKILEVEND